MLGAALIVFREVLEAALIIGIVAAATQGLSGRGRWIVNGIVGGLAGAAAMAALAGQIADLANGIGQELLNAGILASAVVMLAWHNIWMSRHARELSTELKAVGAAVNAGERPLSAIAIVVGLAVLREGAEVVLFLYGIASGGVGNAALFTGGLVGVALGGAVGFALYFGLLRIPTRYLFLVTSWMILLLAGGMAADAAKYLIQADLLPPLGQPLWNTSGILDDRSLFGHLLHTLVGYTARPSGLQVLVYVATIAAIGGLMALVSDSPTRPSRPAAAE